MNKFLKTYATKLSILFCLTLLLNVESTVAASYYAPTNSVKSDSVIKILAIGNSFSADAIEHFLYDLAKAGGHKVIICNLYVGGAELALHWKNAQENNATYDYRKIDVEGSKVKTPKTSIEFALADEDWDYISFQQVSSKSGLCNTYTEPFPALIDYVKSKVTNPNTKYILHQTWAYAQDSKHKGFVNYGNSQKKMYKAIAKTTCKVAGNYKMDVLIPSGTAIQNARTSFVGDKLTRDGYHLDLILGRYTASCVWYEKIFGESVLGNAFIPEKLSVYEQSMAQTAAHKAVLKPFQVTKLKEFRKQP